MRYGEYGEPAFRSLPELRAAPSSAEVRKVQWFIMRRDEFGFETRKVRDRLNNSVTAKFKMKCSTV